MQRYFSVSVLLICSLVCAMENPLSPKLLQILKNSGPVKAASFTPSGHRLAVGGMHPELTIYMEDGDDDDDKLLSIAHCDMKSSILSIDASPNNREFAIGTLNGKIILHDSENRSENGVLLVDEQVNSVQYSKSGLHLLAACNDKCRIWDLLTGSIPRTFNDQAGPVLNAQFNPSDNTQIASCSASDDMITIWDLRQKAIVFRLKPYFPICRIVYNHAGTQFVIATAEQFIVHDCRSAKLLACYDLLGKKSDAPITKSYDDLRGAHAVQFLPGQGDAFFAGLDGGITFCDLNKDANSFSFKATEDLDSVETIAIHPDSTTMAVGLWSANCTKIWDIKALTAKIKKEIK